MGELVEPSFMADRCYPMEENALFLGWDILYSSYRGLLKTNMNNLIMGPSKNASSLTTFLCCSRLMDMYRPLKNGDGNIPKIKTNPIAIACL